MSSAGVLLAAPGGRWAEPKLGVIEASKDRASSIVIGQNMGGRPGLARRYPSRFGGTFPIGFGSRVAPGKRCQDSVHFALVPVDLRAARIHFHVWRVAGERGGSMGGSMG